MRAGSSRLGVLGGLRCPTEPRLPLRAGILQYRRLQEPHPNGHIFPGALSRKAGFKWGRHAKAKDQLAKLSSQVGDTSWGEAPGCLCQVGDTWE